MLRWCSILCSIAAGIAALGATTPAFATPYFQAIDMGVPTDGTRVMTGYRGFILQAVSDLGPIASIALGNFNGSGRTIEGDLAERWTGPGPGFFTTSPGPYMAHNATPSTLNFDSHFIVDASHVTFTAVDPLVGTRQSAPYEDAFYPNGFIQNGDPRFTPDFMPIPSDSTYGYGVAAINVDNQSTWNQGVLEANFNILPAYQSNTLDVAYIVTNGTVFVFGGIGPVGQGQFTAGIHIVVPEPTIMLSTLLIISLLQRKRRSS